MLSEFAPAVAVFHKRISQGAHIESLRLPIAEDFLGSLSDTNGERNREEEQCLGSPETLLPASN